MKKIVMQGILDILFARRSTVVTIKEIAEALGKDYGKVSRRTIQRYLDELRNDGLDIEPVKGKNGGVRFTGQRISDKKVRETLSKCISMSEENEDYEDVLILKTLYAAVGKRSKYFSNFF